MVGAGSIEFDINNYHFEFEDGTTFAFTMLIHVVNYKLFVETNFWNSVTIGASVISLMLYYLFLFAIDFHTMAAIF